MTENEQQIVEDASERVQKISMDSAARPLLCQPESAVPMQGPASRRRSPQRQGKLDQSSRVISNGATD